MTWKSKLDNGILAFFKNKSKMTRLSVIIYKYNILIKSSVLFISITTEKFVTRNTLKIKFHELHGGTIL